MKKTFFLLSILLLFMVSSNAIVEKCIIVKQDDSPIEIQRFSCSYENNINYNLLYQNITDKRIKAVRFSFVSFNVFNEYLHTIKGLVIEDIDPNQASKKATYTDNCYGDFSFLTGIVFVDSARFGDDTIWQANKKLILQEIKKIQDNFEPAMLEEKKPEPK